MIAAARREQAEALLVLEMPATIEHRRQIAKLATSYRLPTLYVGSYGDSGGLIAYGTSREETGRQLAAYVDKILKGAKPGALPVGRLTHHELIVNLETARSIGIAIPSSLLERADRVIHEDASRCRASVFSRRCCAPRLIPAFGAQLPGEYTNRNDYAD